MAENTLTEKFVISVRDRREAMYHMALSYMKNPADAEDAVSEAIEAAWAHLALMRSAEAIPAYLMRCTINACHTALRKKKRETVAEVDSVFDREVEPETPMWEYLGQLPEKYRVVLVMRYGSGIPEQEIAAALHIRRGTVSSRLSRGLELLRAQLKV